jgi:hypothetical protein
VKLCRGYWRRLLAHARCWPAPDGHGPRPTVATRAVTGACINAAGPVGSVVWCGVCGAPESRTPRRWGPGRSFDERNAPRMHGDHTLRSTLSQPAPPALHPYPYPPAHLPAYTERTTRLCAPHPIPPPSAMPARLSPASSRRVIAPRSTKARLLLMKLICLGTYSTVECVPCRTRRPVHPSTRPRIMLQRDCTNGLAKHPSCPSPVPLVSRSRLHVQTPMPIATGNVIPK